MWWDAEETSFVLCTSGETQLSEPTLTVVIIVDDLRKIDPIYINVCFGIISTSNDVGGC